MQSAKTTAALLSLTLLLLTLCGCWDYRGLDDITIVAGVAIDLSETDPGEYIVSMEVIEAGSTNDVGQMASTLLETKGRTIFEAIHRATDQLYGEVYFGNTDILVLSWQVASEQGIEYIVDTFLRDFHTRDSMMILISQNATAREIITPAEDTNIVLSYDISRNLEQKNKSLSATRAPEMHEVYNTLQMNTGSLALPTVYVTDTEGNMDHFTGGSAMFKGDRLVGFLDDDAMPGYLLVTERLAAGTYTYFLTDEQNRYPNHITLLITHTRPRQDIRYENGALTLQVSVEILADAIETPPHLSVEDYKTLQKLEALAEEAFRADIETVIRGVQAGSGCDIFGFGEAAYARHHKDWQQLSHDWEGAFRAADVEVTCDVNIDNTGLIKK